MIVVTTPTGKIGYHLLAKLLGSTPEAIRVIARRPERLPDEVRAGVEIVQGSHSDPAVVTKAFAGADAVFWLVPPNLEADDVKGYYRDFTLPACEAIKNEGIKHVVWVSSLGQDHPKAKNSGLLSAAFAMDRLIEATGVSYRALRMPFFMENLLGQVGKIREEGKFFMANSEDRTLLTVATPDIAEEAAKLLRERSWKGKGDLPVIGPDEMSPNNMAYVMSEVLGRTIMYQQTTVAAQEADVIRMGASKAWAQGVADMVTAQNEGIYDDAPRRVGSRGLTDFRKWSEVSLKPLV